MLLIGPHCNENIKTINNKEIKIDEMLMKLDYINFIIKYFDDELYIFYYHCYLLSIRECNSCTNNIGKLVVFFN